MTAIVFIVALVAAYAHFRLAGFFVAPGLTIYVAAFAAVLAASCVAARVSRDPRCIFAALVLIANFAASHFAWRSGNPPLANGLADIVTAAWFILLGTTRWELTIGAVFLLSAGSAAAARYGLIPYGGRPPVFIAWSYPDITSLLGHAASITLGLGAGDAGSWVRRGLRERPMVFAFRRGLLARLGLVAPVAGKEG